MTEDAAVEAAAECSSDDVEEMYASLGAHEEAIDALDHYLMESVDGYAGNVHGAAGVARAAIGELRRLKLIERAAQRQKAEEARRSDVKAVLDGLCRRVAAVAEGRSLTPEQLRHLARTIGLRREDAVFVLDTLRANELPVEALRVVSRVARSEAPEVAGS